MGMELGKPGSERSTRPAVLVAMSFSLVLAGWIWPSAALAAPAEKQTICHATSAVNNPYVQNTVSVDSIIKDKGHGSHTGPVFPVPGWGDIIPPFDYTGSDGQPAHYPGLNWTTEGIAIWDAACDTEVEPAPTESPSPSSPSSSSPPASESSAPGESSSPPSSSPPASESSAPGESSSPPSSSPPASESSAPGESSSPPSSTATSSGTVAPTSTASSSPAGKPSLPPGVTTSPESPAPSELPPPVLKPAELKRLAKHVATMPPLEAVAVDPGAKVVLLGLLTVPQRHQLAAELRARGLVPLRAPRAGYGGASTLDPATAGWVAAGVSLLVLSGLASIAFWRRRGSS